MHLKAYWDLASIEHIAKHGVTPAEVDYVLARARPPFPEEIGAGKSLVLGPTQTGRLLQVIFVFREIETLDWSTLDWEDQLALHDTDEDEVVYVIHAREMNDREKRALRRRLK